MGYPLWDMLNDLALARGLRGADADSERGYLRGRLAAVAWIPGLALALFAGGWTGSWVVGVGVAVLVLVSIYLVGVGPRTLIARISAGAKRLEDHP